MFHRTTTPTTASHDAPDALLLTPRTRFPGTRALVGGLLVGLAVIGTFFMAAGMHHNAMRTYVIAKQNLPAGTTLTDNNIAVISAPDSPALQSKTFLHPDAVKGAVLLGPLQQGELVQQGAIAKRRSDATHVEMSFALPSSRALDGTLLSGESVDVLATNKGAADTQAVLAVRNARVLRAQATGGAMGKSNEVVITLALGSREDAATLATAIDSGQLTLVRTTGSEQA